MSERPRSPDDVSEEGELLARWLEEQSFFYTSDERAQQNLRRAAAFIRETYLQTATDEQTVDEMAGKVWNKFLKRNEGTFDHMYRGEFIVACRTLVHDNKLRALAGEK